MNINWEQDKIFLPSLDEYNSTNAKYGEKVLSRTSIGDTDSYVCCLTAIHGLIGYTKSDHILGCPTAFNAYLTSEPFNSGEVNVGEDGITTIKLSDYYKNGETFEGIVGPEIKEGSGIYTIFEKGVKIHSQFCTKKEIKEYKKAGGLKKPNDYNTSIVRQKLNDYEAEINPRYLSAMLPAGREEALGESIESIVPLIVTNPYLYQIKILKLLERENPSLSNQERLNTLRNIRAIQMSVMKKESQIADLQNDLKKLSDTIKPNVRKYVSFKK